MKSAVVLACVLLTATCVQAQGNETTSPLYPAGGTASGSTAAKSALLLSDTAWSRVQQKIEDYNVGRIEADGANAFVATVRRPWVDDSVSLMRSLNGSVWTLLRRDVGWLPFTVHSKLYPMDSIVFTAQPRAGYILCTTNFGRTWTQQGERLNYISLLQAAGDSLVVAGTDGQGVRCSTTKGASWAIANDGLPDMARVPLLVDGTLGWVFAGVEVHGALRLHRMHRDAMRWTRADNGIDTGGTLVACTALPGGATFAATTHRIYRSLDHGGTWTEVAQFADSILSMHWRSAKSILVGFTGEHIALSADTGNTWHAYSSGLSSRNIVSIGSNRSLQSAVASDGFLFQRLLAELAAPTLLYPGNGDTAAIQPVSFRWNSQGRFSDIQVSLSPNFSTLFARADSLTKKDFTFQGLPPDRVIYWRVQTWNEMERSPWSQVWKFTAVDSLLPPQQFMPQDRSDSLYLPVTFSWSSVHRATGYGGEVATDSLFHNVVRRWGSPGGTVTDTSLAYGKRFYWHLRSVAFPVVSDWSPTWTFTTVYRDNGGTDTTLVDTTHYPSTPLRAPQNGDRMVMASTHFVWDPIEHAISYRLQVGLDSSFAQPLVDRLLNESRYYACEFPRNTLLHWRVRTGYPGTWSKWSPIWHFTTLLAGPTLRAPRDFSTDVDRCITLQWDSSAGATGYRVQVALNGSWGSPVFDSSGIRERLCSVPLLNPFTTYAWRVYGENSDGRGDASEEWIFVTSGVTRIQDTHWRSGIAMDEVYPNPVHETACIRYRMEHDGRVTFSVFDLYGRKVLERDGSTADAGAHEIRLDTNGLPSGTYLCRLSSSEGILLRSMLVVR